MDPWVVISSSPATTTRDHDQDQHNNSNSAEDTLNDNYIERTSRPNNNSEFEDHFIDIPTTEAAAAAAAVIISATASSTSDNNSTAVSTSSTNSTSVTEPQHNSTSSDNSSDSKTFEKLPDSQVYLASLEKKLNAIQSGKSKKSTTSTNSKLSSGGCSSSSTNYSTKPEARLIQSLEETRESYMVNLLSNTSTVSTESTSADEIHVNPILKKIAPEKQAINTEELLELLKADQLSLLLEQQQATTSTSSKEDNTETVENNSPAEDTEKDKAA